MQTNGIYSGWHEDFATSLEVFLVSFMLSHFGTSKEGAAHFKAEIPILSNCSNHMLE